MYISICVSTLCNLPYYHFTHILIYNTYICMILSYNNNNNNIMDVCFRYFNNILYYTFIQFFVLCIHHENHYDIVKIDFEQLFIIRVIGESTLYAHLHIIIFIKTSRGILVENQLSIVSRRIITVFFKFKYPDHIFTYIM